MFPPPVLQYFDTALYVRDGTFNVSSQKFQAYEDDGSHDWDANRVRICFGGPDERGYGFVVGFQSECSMRFRPSYWGSPVQALILEHGADSNHGIPNGRFRKTHLQNAAIPKSAGKETGQLGCRFMEEEFQGSLFEDGAGEDWELLFES